MKLFLDFETRSTVELKRTGIYPYAVHSDTSLWCMAWAVEFDAPKLWLAGEPFPDEVIDAIWMDCEMWAHNASFERLMWRHVLPKHYPSAPRIPTHKWFCTAAEAARMALPRSLDGACNALGVNVTKDLEGHRLMLRMCRPRSFTPAGTPVWWDDAERLQRLGEYCKNDVLAEQAIWSKLNRLSTNERQAYLLTEEMNDRGVGIDLALVAASKVNVEKELARHNGMLATATEGRILSVTKVEQLKEWLKEQGIDEPSLAKKVVAELLSNNASLPEDVRTVLFARQEAGRASVKKLDSMLEYDVSGRMHGMLMYHGASTGRWAGKGPQVQNFPRGSNVKNPEQYIEPLLSGDPVPLDAVSALLRGMIVPAEGKQFLIGDYAQVEARVVAWLAGEEKMLAQFREKRPIYAEMAEMIYGHPVSKQTDLEKYTVGKSAVLGCGFQLGPRRFYEQFLGGTGYISEEEAQKDGKERNANMVLADRAVRAYRSMYPHIPQFWRALNDAAMSAVANPGTTYRVGKISYVVKGSYLLAVLPSARVLFYADPKIIDHPAPWDKNQTLRSASYMGVDRFTKKWERQVGYGGFWAENVTQAIARDVMRDAMFRLEENGYPLVLSVHDELVAEVPMDRNADDFLALMKETPSWAEGLPLDVEGKAASRWGK